MRSDITLQVGDEVIFKKRTNKKHNITLQRGTITTITVNPSNVTVRFAYDQQPSIYRNKIIPMEMVYFVIRNDGKPLRIEGYGLLKGFLL